MQTNQEKAELLLYDTFHEPCIAGDTEHLVSKIDILVEAQKESIGLECDIHNSAMLDGMMIIQAVANGRPWPL